MTRPDLITRPPHYTSHPSGVETIELCERLTFCGGNVIKYLWRHSLKGGVEDLRKAEWYLKRAGCLLRLDSCDAMLARTIADADRGVLGDVLRLMVAREFDSVKRYTSALELVRDAIAATPSRDARAEAQTIPPAAVGDEEVTKVTNLTNLEAIR